MIPYIEKVAREIIEALNNYRKLVNLPIRDINEEGYLDGIIKGVELYWRIPVPPKEQHERWVARQLLKGWVYGEEFSVENKTHPALVDYEEVPLKYLTQDYIFMAIAEEKKPVIALWGEN